MSTIEETISIYRGEPEAPLSPVAEHLGLYRDHHRVSQVMDQLWAPPHEPEDTAAVSFLIRYVALHAGKRTALHRATIAQLAAQIGPSFVRIHRSTLLRLNALQELRNGDTLAVVADGTTLRVGRSYREQLRQRIQQDRPDRS